MWKKAACSILNCSSCSTVNWAGPRGATPNSGGMWASDVPVLFPELLVLLELLLLFVLVLVVVLLLLTTQLLPSNTVNITTFRSKANRNHNIFTISKVKDKLFPVRKVKGHFPILYVIGKILIMDRMLSITPLPGLYFFSIPFYYNAVLPKYYSIMITSIFIYTSIYENNERVNNVIFVLSYNYYYYYGM